MFTGRKLLIATKHQKEKIIAPLMEKALAVHCFTSTTFDTDSLGTFSGEIERKNDALTTLRNKCVLGYQNTDCDLVIASEGSFGSHPTLFFASANEEMVMLKDFKNDIEIVARELSLETNSKEITIEFENDLVAFAQNIQFPTHGIILKSSEKNPAKIYKDFNSLAELLERYNDLKLNYSNIYAETDMRAHRNPTRMKVIEKTTYSLIDKIKSSCPNCKTPGFDVISAQFGLPCALCSMPTRSTLSHLYQCKKCGFKQEKMFPRDIQVEDPTYCDNCNP
jgi:hypothetical protein